MTPVDVIGLSLAIGLFVYLVVALLYPEKFQ
jgi:K+-transporting ATPase KdpF subunit